MRGWDAPADACLQTAHGLQGRDAPPNAPGMDGKNLSQPLN